MDISSPSRDLMMRRLYSSGRWPGNIVSDQRDQEHEGHWSECDSYAGKDRQWRAEHLGATIGQGYRRPHIRDIARVKKCSKERDPLVECVVDQPKNLHLLGKLIRSVQIDSPIAGQFGVLIGIISDKIRAPHDDHIRANCPSRSRRVKRAQFSLVQRETRNAVTWNHVNIAVRIGQWIIR